MAVLAPMPMASESTMTRVSPGLLNNVRNPKRKSERIERIFLLGRSLQSQVSIPLRRGARTRACSVHTRVNAFCRCEAVPLHEQERCTHRRDAGVRRRVRAPVGLAD